MLMLILMLFAFAARVLLRRLRHFLRRFDYTPLSRRCRRFLMLPYYDYAAFLLRH